MPSFLAPTLGSILISTGLSSVLYGVTCGQSFLYFRKYAREDIRGIKILIGSLWIFNSLHVILNYQVAYHYFITAASNFILYEETVWSIPIGALVIVIVSVQAYGFHTWRLWKLTRGNYTLCVMLSILNAGHFSAIMVMCVKGFVDDELKVLQHFTSQSSITMKMMRIAVGLAALMEIIVTISLCWSLAKDRRGFALTKTVIKFLIAYAINTGLIAFVNLLFAFISGFLWPNTYMWWFFVVLVPPFETNACLGTLNGRDYLRHFGQEHDNIAFSISNLPHPINRTIEVRVDKNIEIIPMSPESSGIYQS